MLQFTSAVGKLNVRVLRHVIITKLLSPFRQILQFRFRENQRRSGQQITIWKFNTIVPYRAQACVWFTP